MGKTVKTVLFARWHVPSKSAENCLQSVPGNQSVPERWRKNRLVVSIYVLNLHPETWRKISDLNIFFRWVEHVCLFLEGTTRGQMFEGWGHTTSFRKCPSQILKPFRICVNSWESQGPNSPSMSLSNHCLGCGFKQFLIFTPNPGEMIQFDKYIWNGLKPPTSYPLILSPS